MLGMADGMRRLTIRRPVGGAGLLLAAAAMLAELPADAAPVVAVHYIVYVGARVIDPETGLDAKRNMAVDGDRIVAVSEAPLQGRRVIDARGLVAAPGFIDIHSHATTRETARYQARDGVTTRLELEIDRKSTRLNSSH